MGSHLKMSLPGRVLDLTHPWGFGFFSLSLCLCESLKASVFISRSAAEKSTENEWGNTDSLLLFANRAESKAPRGCVQLQFCIHA